MEMSRLEVGHTFRFDGGSSFYRVVAKSPGGTLYCRDVKQPHRVLEWTLSEQAGMDVVVRNPGEVAS